MENCALSRGKDCFLTGVKKAVEDSLVVGDVDVGEGEDAGVDIPNRGDGERKERVTV
jgi:hypothetical protein